MIRLCIAGATGRMGSTLINEAVDRGFQVNGAVAAADDPNIGKTLTEAGICNLDVRILPPSRLGEAVRDADVYMTFTTPEAEVENLPKVADFGKRIVMGTTGFTDERMKILREAVSTKVPAVFSPNYALGVNILFRLIKVLALFPPDYDFSITEVHHTGKKDAPSGTAKKLGSLVSEARGYSKVVYGREGISPRRPEELEVLTVRTGGVPGIHDLIVAGPHEMIRIEHMAFSRRVFAQGALLAAEWINRQD
ncbi:MAG: 4-hydroxy-tetrahydrodipicolinate reductase, partial [Candidatus Bathyarchaeia archaeon]